MARHEGERIRAAEAVSRTERRMRTDRRRRHVEAPEESHVATRRRRTVLGAEKHPVSHEFVQTSRNYVTSEELQTVVVATVVTIETVDNAR